MGGSSVSNVVVDVYVLSLCDDYGEMPFKVVLTKKEAMKAKKHYDRIIPFYYKKYWEDGASDVRKSSIKQWFDKTFGYFYMFTEENGCPNIAWYKVPLKCDKASASIHEISKELRKEPNQNKKVILLEVNQ